MQVYNSGNKTQLNLSIEDALILQEQLAKAIRFAIAHRVSSFSSAAYTQGHHGVDAAGVLNVTVSQGE